MFFSKKTVEDAIRYLMNTSHTFTKRNGNPDMLAYFLILKRIGASRNKWIEKKELFNNSSDVSNSISQLGGMFSEEEVPDKRGCFFFSSFCKSRGELKVSDFYNQGTTFSGLPGRFKDTIDNSIADYLLDKGLNDSYRLKSNHLSVVKNNYSNKFPLDCILIWIYRFLDINKDITISQLRAVFLNEYKLSNNDAREIFDFSSSIPIQLSNTPISSEDIREILGVTHFVEFKGNDDNKIYNFYPNINKQSIIEINLRMNNNKEKITSLLSKYKQVIITGVPGTGKSFIVDEIAKDYEEYKKIQFHQNYTYQQFILGKTIEDGVVITQEGELLTFLKIVNENSDKNYLLIIDEINRGNVSSIFGEALYALDRGNEIKIENNIILSLPNNLYIIGTMNTADRSIAIVDFAIRRRFLFAELEPDYDLLDQLAKINGEEILGDFLKKINDNILNNFENEDYLFGHSYFLGKENIEAEDIYNIIHYQIIPMIIEYAHADKSVVNNIFPQKLLESQPDNLIENIKEFINE